MFKCICTAEYEQGYQSRLLTPLLPCPYPAGSAEMAEWERGYQDADTHFVW